MHYELCEHGFKTSFVTHENVFHANYFVSALSALSPHIPFFASKTCIGGIKQNLYLLLVEMYDDVNL